MPRVHTLASNFKRTPGLAPLPPPRVHGWQSTSMGGHKPAGYAKSSVGFIAAQVDAGTRYEHYGRKEKC
jgi:hypothetical protein